MAAARVLCSSFDCVSLLITRRGFASAAGAAAAKGSKPRAAGEEKVAARRDGEAAAAASSWVPDPVTGYYRPANCGVEMDAAEMREVMLSRRVES